MSVSVWDHLNPLDVAELERVFQNAGPTRFFCIDGFLRSEFADEVRRSYPSYLEAVQLGHQFSAVNERLKVQVCDAKRFPEPVRILNDVLAASEFLQTLSEITGIAEILADESLAGGGMHLTASSGRLDVHVDFNLHEERRIHRRLNLLVFLNEAWREEWGGAFELWDPSATRLLESFAPLHNRCVVFNTTAQSFHGVTPVRCPQGTSRRSFAAYYYTQAPPDDWDGQAHSTIFRARPQEWWRGRILMPSERLMRRVSRLPGVGRLLRRSE